MSAFVKVTTREVNVEAADAAEAIEKACGGDGSTAGEYTPQWAEKGWESPYFFRRGCALDDADKSVKCDLDGFLEWIEWGHEAEPPQVQTIQ